jgi:hypothetical protein
LIKNASMQVLARATMKRKDQKGDQEIWTAPILVSLEDRESRWELEDLLRGSNLYPTFHWNREMVGLVKEMRSSLKEKYPEEKHFIRIRPEEREDKWRIKADVKRRGEDGARFKFGASWDIPPMCPDVRKQNPEWIKPSWAQVAGASKDPAPSGSGECEGMDL